MKKLVGRNDIEDALKRLDKLTQDEARMAIAENLKGKVIMQQTAQDVDEVKRSSSTRLHRCPF
jgi:hypothetical protein